MESHGRNQARIRGFCRMGVVEGGVDVVEEQYHSCLNCMKGKGGVQNVGNRCQLGAVRGEGAEV